MIYKRTEFFEQASGKSYAEVHTTINKELDRQGFEIDRLDYGKPLINLLQNNETNMMGFFVACWPDVHSEILALLTGVIIFGDGDCKDCGGDLEHFDTIGRSDGMVVTEVKCNICGLVTEYRYEE